MAKRRLLPSEHRGRLPAIAPGCPHYGNGNLLIPNADRDPHCWRCGYVSIEVPAFIVDIIEPCIGQRTLPREPRYRGIEL